MTGLRAEQSLPLDPGKKRHNFLCGIKCLSWNSPHPQNERDNISIFGSDLLKLTFLTQSKFISNF